MTTIGSLPTEPLAVLYQRPNGQTFSKLNDEFHIKAVVHEGRIMAEGVVERFDPNERVVVVAR